VVPLSDRSAPGHARSLAAGPGASDGGIMTRRHTRGPHPVPSEVRRSFVLVVPRPATHPRPPARSIPGGKANAGGPRAGYHARRTVDRSTIETEKLDSLGWACGRSRRAERPRGVEPAFVPGLLGPTTPRKPKAWDSVDSARIVGTQPRPCEWLGSTLAPSVTGHRSVRCAASASAPFCRPSS
jgi:hypothetical protein